MKVVTKYPDGLFSWVDLATTDTDAAKAFYTGLFGWDAVGVETDRGPIYTMYQIEGHTVAGMGPLPPDMQAQGVPPIWSSYVKHDDVDSIVAKAAEAGGTVTMPPMDVMEEGRMAMIQDPSGAMFGVWQPKNHIGAALVNQPNTLFWNELQTHDVEACKAFYSAVFGWANETDGTGYVAFSQDKRVQAGMMKIDPSWGEVPPHWGVYFMVDDVEATTAKVKELGGIVLVPPTPAGDMGHFSLVQDPQGGTFTVMQVSGPVDEPPGYE